MTADAAHFISACPTFEATRRARFDAGTLLVGATCCARVIRDLCMLRVFVYVHMCVIARVHMLERRHRWGRADRTLFDLEAGLK